jgi:peroxiredoxin
MSEKAIVLTIGDSAPDFNAADYAGKPVQLSSSLSEGTVVLIFLRGFR